MLNFDDIKTDKASIIRRSFKRVKMNDHQRGAEAEVKCFIADLPSIWHGLEGKNITSTSIFASNWNSCSWKAADFILHFIRASFLCHFIRIFAIPHTTM